MGVWDIAALPTREQCRYWHEVTGQAFVPLTTRRTLDEEGFAAKAETRGLAGTNRARLRSRPQRTDHGPREVARDRRRLLHRQPAARRGQQWALNSPDFTISGRDGLQRARGQRQLRRRAAPGGHRTVAVPDEGQGVALTRNAFFPSGASIGLFAVAAVRGAFEIAHRSATTEARGGAVPIIDHQAVADVLADAKGRSRPCAS